MVERNLDGSYLITLYREWIKNIRKKNEFLKNISEDYIKMEKKFIQFFQDRVLAQKRAPAGHRTAKKKVFEKHWQGGHKKGLHQRDGKKMVMDGLSL